MIITKLKRSSSFLICYFHVIIFLLCPSVGLFSLMTYRLNCMCVLVSRDLVVIIAMLLNMNQGFFCQDYECTAGVHITGTYKASQIPLLISCLLLSLLCICWLKISFTMQPRDKVLSSRQEALVSDGRLYHLNQWSSRYDKKNDVWFLKLRAYLHEMIIVSDCSFWWIRLTHWSLPEVLLL